MKLNRHLLLPAPHRYHTLSQSKVNQAEAQQFHFYILCVLHMGPAQKTSWRSIHRGTFHRRCLFCVYLKRRPGKFRGFTLEAKFICVHIYINNSMSKTIHFPYHLRVKYHIPNCGPLTINLNSKSRLAL